MYAWLPLATYINLALGNKVQILTFPQTSSGGQPGFPTGSEFWAPHNFA